MRYRISVIAVLTGLLVTGCTSSPSKFGYAEVSTSYWCYDDPSPESHSFKALISDNTSKNVDVIDDIEMKVWNDRNGGKFLTGKCELKAILQGIPLTNFPYKVEFYIDNELLLPSKSFDLDDVQVYEK
jgi:hypothetical protein